jgi:hypothetical protein
LVATALVCLAERILTLGFWLFVLISDLRDFLMPGFALAIEVGVLVVRLHRFGKLLLSLFYYYYFSGEGGLSLLSLSRCFLVF